jgi:hypothetical protein
VDFQHKIIPQMQQLTSQCMVKQKTEMNIH